MIIHLLCCSWGLPSWNAPPASIARGSPKLHSCIHTSPFRVLGKQKSYFGCSRVIISVYEVESYPGCAAKVLRRWNAPEGAWDEDEAMGSCTRTRWTGIPLSVVWVGPAHRIPAMVPHWWRGQRMWPWEKGPDLCLTLCEAARQNNKSTKTSKALAFPAEPQ